MFTVISSVIYTMVVLIAILLIILVLVQPSKSGGLGSAFGGVGESVFGAQAMGQLSKLTVVLLTLFFILTLLLAIMTGHRTKDSGIKDSVLAGEKTTMEQTVKKETSAPAPVKELKKNDANAANKKSEK